MVASVTVTITERNNFNPKQALGPGGRTMNRLDFLILCESHLVHPSIALENEAIKEALESKNDKLVQALFEMEF